MDARRLERRAKSRRSFACLLNFEPTPYNVAMATVLDQVRSFIERLSPAAVCDDCIAERLQLSVRQHANHKTRELAGAHGFERSKGPCSLCDATKFVICKRHH